MPNVPRSARKEFEEKRIPGAQFLDLDAVASKHELGLAHMMPSASVFAAACGQLMSMNLVAFLIPFQNNLGYHRPLMLSCMWKRFWLPFNY